MQNNTDISKLIERANGLRTKPRAESTRYRDACAIRTIRRWASGIGLHIPDDRAWSPDIVLAYIGAHIDRCAFNSMAAQVAAIRRWHTDRGLESPTAVLVIRETMSGLKRRLPRVVRRMTPLPAHAIRTWLACPTATLRSKVGLLVGFVTGLRAGELVALQWADVRRLPDKTIILEDGTKRLVPGGREITVRRSKTDQAGNGRVAGLPHADSCDETGCAPACPVAWLEHWRGCAKSGRIFAVTKQQVWVWAKRAAAVAGLDPKTYGAHSLRSGLATAASSGGAALSETMSAGGWETASIAAKYARSEATQNAAHRAAVRALEE